MLSMGLTGRAEVRTKVNGSTLFNDRFLAEDHFLTHQSRTLLRNLPVAFVILSSCTPIIP